MPATAAFGVSRGARRVSVSSRSAVDAGAVRADRSGRRGPEDHRGLGQCLGVAGRPGHDRGLDDVRDRRPPGSRIDEVVGRATVGAVPALDARSPAVDRRAGCRDAEVRTFESRQPRARSVAMVWSRSACRRRRPSSWHRDRGGSRGRRPHRRRPRSPRRSIRAPGPRASPWRRRRGRTAGPTAAGRRRRVAPRSTDQVWEARTRVRTRRRRREASPDGIVAGSERRRVEHGDVHDAVGLDLGHPAPVEHGRERRPDRDLGPRVGVESRQLGRRVEAGQASGPRTEGTECTRRRRARAMVRAPGPRPRLARPHADGCRRARP